MSVEWKTLRAELPTDVREHLDHVRAARRLGSALSETRREADISQQHLAADAGMTQNTASRIEHADALARKGMEPFRKR